MAVSGHQLDAQFAEGFLTTLSSRLAVRQGATGHWRPEARLDVPLGRVTGDLGFTFDGSDGETLLIVEREGSAPGNERNILKWVAALDSGAVIRLKSGPSLIECSPSAVILLLAFGRSAKWDRTDFEKTIAFCDMLAEFVNKRDCNNSVPLRVLVNASPALVSDWQECGSWMAERFAESQR